MRVYFLSELSLDDYVMSQSEVTTHCYFSMILEKLVSFIVYSLSFNLADLNWPEQPSTSTRYVWSQQFLFYFFPGTLWPSQEEVPRHASAPGQLWYLCSSSSTHRCQRTRNVSRTWPRLSYVVTQINFCPVATCVLHLHFLHCYACMQNYVFFEMAFKIPLQAGSE